MEGEELRRVGVGQRPLAHSPPDAYNWYHLYLSAGQSRRVGVQRGNSTLRLRKTERPVLKRRIEMSEAELDSIAAALQATSAGQGLVAAPALARTFGR
jgi:hypothetical protein